MHGWIRKKNTDTLLYSIDYKMHLNFRNVNVLKMHFLLLMKYVNKIQHVLSSSYVPLNVFSALDKIGSNVSYQ